jgi:uncharacterized protein (TIGR02217 family)
MSIAFLESPRFPDEIAFWATGGRGFKTTVIETYGGDEYRNAAWSQRRGEWSVANAWRRNYSSNAQYNLPTLTAFINVARGQLGAFRFKDFTDYKDSDAGGAGTFVMIDSTHFQMYKTYTNGAQTYAALIQKPVSGTVIVTGGSSPSVDYTTGIVTVSSGTPTSWTGQYDVPVRFAEDISTLGPDESTGALYNWQALKLIEVRNP